MRSLHALGRLLHALVHALRGWWIIRTKFELLDDAHRAAQVERWARRMLEVLGIELVVHVDPPEEHKAYLHRSGRTARAGAEGIVVTVALDSQRRDVQDLLRRAKIAVPFEQVTPDAAAVAALVGEPAPYVKPEPVPQGGSAGGRGSGSAAGSKPRSKPRTAAGRGEGSRKQRTRQDGARTESAAPTQGTGSRRSRGGRGKAASAAASAPAAPQAGRSASGRPTTGALVGGARRSSSRRASHPGGR